MSRRLTLSFVLATSMITACGDDTSRPSAELGLVGDGAAAVDAGQPAADSSGDQMLAADTGSAADTGVAVDAKVAVSDTRPAGMGTSIGTFWNTYYYLANEADYSGAATTTLYDSKCKALLKVSSKFSDAVCIEGSGKLKDGRVINYAKSCSCGRKCPTGGIVCYSILDKTKYPWGAGAGGRSLKPFVSWAIDRNEVTLGTVLYAKQWDGKAIPKVGALGGFTHDGCFLAADVGGGIKGKHFDFFAGTRAMYLALEKIFPTRSNFAVYKNAPRCSHLTP